MLIWFPALILYLIDCLVYWFIDLIAGFPKLTTAISFCMIVLSIFVDICWTFSAAEIVFWCCAVEFGSFWCIIQDDCCGEIGSLCKDCFVFSSTHWSGIMEIVWCSHVCSRVLSWWYLLKCLCSGDWFSMPSCLMLAVDLLLDDCDSLDQPKRWDWFVFSSTRWAAS